MNKNKILFLGMTITALALVAVGCKKDTTRVQEKTGDAVNDVVNATRGVLKTAVERIDNAVYK